MKKFALLLMFYSFLYSLKGDISISVPKQKNKQEINIIVAVKNDDNIPITGLVAKNFDVYLDGKLIDKFAVGAAKEKIERLTIIIDIDSSGSMKNSLKKVKEAAGNFVSRLGNDVRIALYTFNDTSQRIIDFTYDKAVILNKINRITTRGNYTLLYDTIYDSLVLLSRKEASNKALVVFTDGLDENSALEIGDIVDKNRKLQIPIYIFSVSKAANTKLLKRITKLSGGIFLEKSNNENIKRLIETLLKGFKNKYTITIPIEKNFKKFGKHKIFVSVETQGRRYSADIKLNLRNKGIIHKLSDQIKSFYLKEINFYIVYGILILLSLILFIFIIKRIIKIKGDIANKNNESDITDFLGGPLDMMSSETSSTPIMSDIDDEDDTDIIDKEELFSQSFQDTFIVDSTDDGLDHSIHVNNKETMREKESVFHKEKPSIIEFSGPSIGKEQVIDGDEVYIGRSSVCDFIINDPKVSAKHLMIKKVNKVYILYDIAPDRPVYVNGKKMVKPISLKDGDEIRIGDTAIVFKF